MVKVFICMICGDAYLGEIPPSNCPFCGAHSNFIREDAKWPVPEEPIKNLTPKTKDNLIASIRTELRNANFYACAAEKAKDIRIQKLFKFLRKIEMEHATVFNKALGLKDFPKVDVSCVNDDTANLRQAREYETDAINHYKQFLKEATEARAKLIFTALIDVENDHLAVEGEKLGLTK